MWVIALRLALVEIRVCLVLECWAGVRVTCQVNHQTEVCCHEVHRRVMFKIYTRTYVVVLYVYAWLLSTLLSHQKYRYTK